MPPRVLHVAQPVDGGVGAYAAAAVADQRSRGWDVALACPPDGELPQAARTAGVPVHAWRASRSPGGSVPGELRVLAGVVRDVCPDVVHLHSSKAGLVGRLLLRGRTPTLFQPHGWSWLAVTGPVATASRGWERAGARWADRLVCVGDGEADLGRAAGVRGGFAVVRNGVDTVALGQPVAGARARLGLPEGVPVALCVGRLSRQKGQDRLLAAWPQVRARCPGALLALAGDGPDRAALQGADGVVLLGALADVRYALAAADVVVLPSRWEGLSLALLEALAAGRSTVTTRVPGAEVVPAGGGLVLDADPLDDAAVAAALVPALLDRLEGPRAAAEGAVARAYAAAELDVSATWRRLAALTQGLAG